MNKFTDSEDMRVCGANKAVGLDPCTTDISDLHGNAKYCKPCAIKVQEFYLQPEQIRASKRRKSRAKIDTAFKKYHEAHPDRYERIVWEGKLLVAGDYFPHYSMRSLFGRLRDEAIAIPNNYSRPYRELIEQNEPDLRGFFTGGK